MEGSFSYLSDILLKEQLFDFASLIRDNFPSTVSQNSKLSEKLDGLSNTWPSEILRVYRERQAPLYSSKDIVRLNVQNASEIQSVNSTRAKIEKTLHEQIASCNIQIQQHRSQLDRRLAQYHDKLTEIDNQLTMYNDSPNLIPTIDRDDHPLRLQYKRRAVTSSIQSENT